MKYRVKYGSEGLLSGKSPGDVVDVRDEADAKHLLALDLIETEADYKARKEAREPESDEPPAPKAAAPKTPAPKAAK